MLSAKSKARIGARAAKGLALNEGMRDVALESLPPVAGRRFRPKKRRARRREQLGLLEHPKPKRTTPRVAAGVVLGATAVYFLDPHSGAQHRRQLQDLVGSVT
jgi:hypothetical protein